MPSISLLLDLIIAITVLFLFTNKEKGSKENLLGDKKMEINKPTEVFKDGSVQAAIFAREYQGQPSPSCCLQIGFKKEGKWENRRISITNRDYPKVLKVLQQAAAKMGVA